MLVDMGDKCINVEMAAVKKIYFVYTDKRKGKCQHFTTSVVEKHI